MWKKLGGLLFGGLIAFQSVYAQPNVLLPNDECGGSNGFGATPISGAGSWGYSFVLATPSTQPLPSCVPAGMDDIWYCWTANYTGTMDIAARNISLGGFDRDCIAFAVYDGCTCPTAGTAPLVCSVACASSFNVVCGQQYLIRIWQRYPNLDYGVLKITPQNPALEPCVPEPGSCPACCGSKPSYDDPLYTNNFTGRVAVMTANSDPNGTAYPSVTIFNLDYSASPPAPPTDWNPVPGAAPSAFRYSKPGWSKASLGSVCGLTLNDQGDIFIAFCGTYGNSNGSTCGTTTAVGSLTQSSSTSIYKLANGSGAVQLLCNLPGGSNDPNDPGIGNITFDCERQVMFASHFGDGRIYRVSANGTILNAYDHARNAVDPLPNGNDLDPTRSALDYHELVPLGERVWAVQVFQGRLYYSVWGTSKDNFSGSAATVVTPNSVWSVALTPGSGGDFVPGSRRMEVQVPLHPDSGNAYLVQGVPYSAPVSDISFSSRCEMLLAERDMESSTDCRLAHTARALEFGWNGAAWIPTSNYRNGLGYEIGLEPALSGTNCAGGCDYDYSPSTASNDSRLWVTADYASLASSSTPSYGMNGLLTTSPTGSSDGTTVVIDYDGTFPGDFVQKMETGDIEIPCVRAACATLEGRITCQTVNEDGWTGNYVYTFAITNNSGRPVTRLLIPSGPVSPNTIVPVGPDGVGAPLQSGQTSNPITITINGPITGPTFSLPVIMYTPAAAGGEEVCCNITEELTLPDCACFQLTAGPTVACTLQRGVFTLSFTLQPLAYDIGHVFITPPTGPLDPQELLFWSNAIGPSPDYVPVTIFAGNTQAFQFSIQQLLGGLGSVGTTQCVEVYTHTPDLSECCMREVCFVVPNCVGRGDPECGNIDFNNDTSLFDPQDIEAFLSVYAEGPCVPTNATCNSIDFNSDGSLFDPCDISSFLLVYSEGPCTPCGQ